MKRVLSKIIITIVLFNAISLAFLCPVPVLALSAGGLNTTIASIILSLILECGVAPVNQAWLTALNNSYGVESSIGTIQDCINTGLLTQQGSTLIDTGLSTAIEAQSAYTELGLSQIFTTTADDVAMGAVAASGGANIAGAAINCGTLGTIGAFAGAAAVGVGLGILINKIYDVWKNGIDYELSLPEVLKLNSRYALPGGTYILYSNLANTENPGFYSYPYKCIMAYYKNPSTGEVGFLSRNMNDVDVTVFSRPKALTSDTVNSSIFRSGLIRESYHYNISYFPENLTPMFNNKNDALDYLRGLQDANPKTTFMSPDLIGPGGNHTSSYNPDTGYTYNNRNPVVPDGYDMKPVDLDDYQNFADNANNNTDNGNTGQEQGAEFDDLINGLLVEPSIVPDQGVTVPDVPDRPIIPDQPDTPDKEPITGEQQNQVLEGITTPDLRSVFPFCIPFDLFAIFGVLEDPGREAPVIVWEGPEGKGWSIVIDLSPYDEVAKIARLMELILFIVGLAISTRNLIGA